jgi:hypothetical protein
VSHSVSVRLRPASLHAASAKWRVDVPDRDALAFGDRDGGAVGTPEPGNDQRRRRGDRVAQPDSGGEVVDRDRLFVRRGQEDPAVPAELERVHLAPRTRERRDGLEGVEVVLRDAPGFRPDEQPVQVSIGCSVPT